MRDRSLDIGKGLAILFVYLGHSILYHPIEMNAIYPWCHWLERFIVSFNLPMFFIISGYLFSKTHKSTGDLYKGKVLRILTPYLTTMAIIICSKLLLPQSMSYNSAVSGGAKSLISNALLYGGDKWFIYSLFLIFLIVIPSRNYLRNKWVSLSVIVVCAIVYLKGIMPSIFCLEAVVHFMIFFLAGMCLNEYYDCVKRWSLKYWWLVYLIFVLFNGVLLLPLLKVNVVYRLLLPFTGSLAMMTMAFQLEKAIEQSKVVQYIEYIGKYSLQFYLFTFCYPIIRVVIVSVMHVTNPVIILISVFLLQLVSTTIIVEITRRIKWLKIPFGY